MTRASRQTLSVTEPLPLNAIGLRGTAFEVNATSEQCAAIAHRLGLPGIETIRAEGIAKWVDQDTVTLEVSFSAGVLQLCVVSLEKFASAVADEFVVTYTRNDAHLENAGEAERAAAMLAAGEDRKDGIFIDPDAQDPPERLTSSGIDFGEMIIQHLSLALDPYPRKPGIAASAASALEWDTKAGDGGAFAELAGMRTKSHPTSNSS